MKTATQTWLAFILLVVVSGVVFVLFMNETPPSNRDLISLVLGVLLGALKDVYSYFFGSTHTADAKDELVQTALRSTPPPDAGTPG